MKKAIFLACLVFSSVVSPLFANNPTQETSLWLPKAFVHPGLMQNRRDLDHVKGEIRDKNPIFLHAFENLKKEATLDFVPQPFTHVVRGSYGRQGQGHRELSASALASYQHALLWYITEDATHAQKAIEILNAWSNRLWDFDENDAKLIAALTGQHFLNAAEILRYSNSGWREDDITAFTEMMLTVFYPVMENFFTEANGNWDAAMINTLLGIGVFADRPDIFRKAVERFYWGPNNGGITKYIYPNGQIQESTRDWPHVQLGLGEFAKAAQIAWTQGLDFYAVGENRLALGFEYTAKFMLGEEVSVYGTISQRGRGEFRDIYEPIYQHYATVKGIPLPYTEKAIQRTRPDSGLLFLVSQKAPVAEENTRHKKMTPLSTARPQTGANAQVSYTAPPTSIIVKPGGNIQTALDKAAGTDAWVVLEKGIHTLKKPLLLPSSVTLAGKGLETVIHLDPELSDFTLGTKEGFSGKITIRDLLIEGAITTDPVMDPNQERRVRARMSAPRRMGLIISAEKWGDLADIHLENLTVQNFTQHGVSIRGGGRIKIIHCDFSDNGSNVVPGEGLHHNLHLIRVKDAHIEKSRFSTSPWGSGIHISHSENITCIENEIARNQKHGIHIAESSGIHLAENLAEGNDGHGIFLETWMRGVASGEIQGNLLRNNGHFGLWIDAPDSIPMQPNRQIDNRLRNFGHISGDKLDGVMASLLEKIDLQQEGLQRVDESKTNLVLAAREMLTYFKSRIHVKHPVSSDTPTEEGFTQSDLELANNALRHVMRGQPAYPSFSVGKDIDWSSRPVPDNEWVWQLNRMGFWTAMGKVYRHTKEEKYALAWANQIVDWIKKNPNDKEHGYAWRSIETGIRGHLWTGLYQYFLQSDHFTPEVLVSFLKSCEDHASYLTTVYRTGSNWALMEAEGMAYIAMTFPEFSDSKAWLEEAVRRLNKEITFQVYSDGHQRELAFGYHTGSIGWFLRSYEMAKLNGLERMFSDNYLSLIEKMCEVPMKLAFPDGTTPQFGDAWTGKPGQYHKQLERWGELFGRPDFLYVATDGTQGQRPTETAFAYKESGLYSMRSGWTPDAISLVLKCGPDGGGHSQPDNGTFELYAGGRNLTPDSGSFIYSGDPENRAWFRQTKVHQTLTLNGENAAYAPKLLLWQPGTEVDILVVENQSYEGLAHRRAVLFVDKRYVVIIDEAIGKAGGTLDLNFQLAPGPAELDSKSLSAQTLFEDGYNLWINTLPQKEIEMKEAEGQVSFIYTQKEPRPAFSFQVEKKQGTNGYRFATVLIPFKDDRPDVSVRLLGNPKIGSNRMELEVTEDGRTKTIRYELSKENLMVNRD